MTLFDIPDNVYSHPDYYPLKRHVANIAAAFDEGLHQKAAYFHDLGKLNKTFQININDGGPLPYHALASALFFLCSAGMTFDRESFGIFISILKHHGSLEDVQVLADNLMDDERIRYAHPELFDTIRHIQSTLDRKIDFDLEACCDLFDEAAFVEAYGLSGLKSYFQVKEIFSKLVFGDKYEAIFKEAYQDKTRLEAKLYQDNLLNILNGKMNALSPVRNAARSDVMNAFTVNREKRIFFLEAPTGLGKTFTSLQLALNIADLKNKKRIICALPMTSIIDQTHREYSKIIDNQSLLKFHHLSKPKDYVDREDEEKNEKEYFRQKNDFLGASWGLDKVIVTTFNQVFNAFYSNQNRDLVKFWALKDSVIIFDEIQSIPRILLRDFAKTVRYLSDELNVDFILMSATIPAVKPMLPPDTWCNLLDERYYAMDFNNRYTLAFKEEINTPKILVEQIRKAVGRHNSVLCVVNTKKLAWDIFKEVRKFIDCNEIFLLSTLFIPKHRKAIIKKIVKRLSEKKKTILISTQVIEAGVDLDFDFGFREFAPLYSIIQTAGRINREDRKEISETASLIVTNKIGNSPYHDTDLQYEEVSQLLETPLRENQTLSRLKQYFSDAINRTCPESILIGPMKQLKFQTVMEKFNKNFMKTLPNLCPVYIEVRDGLYERFVMKRNQLIQNMRLEGIPLEQKMEIKSRLKRLDKYISNYVINVGTDDAAMLSDFENYQNMKVCRFSQIGSVDKSLYSIKQGWKGPSSVLLF